MSHLLILKLIFKLELEKWLLRRHGRRRRPRRKLRDREEEEADDVFRLLKLFIRLLKLFIWPTSNSKLQNTTETKTPPPPNTTTPYTTSGPHTLTKTHTHTDTHIHLDMIAEIKFILHPPHYPDPLSYNTYIYMTLLTSSHLCARILFLNTRLGYLFGALWI